MDLLLDSDDVYSQYYRRKIIETVLFADSVCLGEEAISSLMDPKDLYCIPMLSSLDFTLKNVVSLTEMALNNAYDFLAKYSEFLKNYEGEDKKYWISKIQSLIVFLNEREIVSNIDFAMLESRKRLFWLDRISMFLHKEYDYTEFFMISISFDVFVLYLLSTNVLDEDFEDLLASYLIKPGVFQSVTVFMRECPALFSDSFFLGRLLRLFDENRKLYFHQQSYYSLDDEDYETLRDVSFVLQNEVLYARVRRIGKIF